MKNLKTLFATFTNRSFSIGWICLSLLFTTNTKAQDDPHCGILIDGVLAESIPSWGFGDLSVVFPIKQKWKEYDVIEAYLFSNGGYLFIGSARLTPESLNEFADAKYAVMNIFTKEGKNKGIVKGNPEWTTLTNKNSYATSHWCDECSDYKDLKKEATSMVFEVRGHKIGGYKEIETYHPNTGETTKTRTPIYENGKELKDAYRLGDLLYKSKTISYPVCYCNYNKKALKAAEKNETRDKCVECEIDYSKPPVIPGQKFTLQIEKADYEGKFGKIKGGNSNNKTEVKTNTTTKTTVTKTTTTKTTSGNTTTKTDPNLVPYVEKWDNGKIKIQGQKNKDDENEGTWKYYDESGKLWKTEEYKDNELISTKEN